MSIFAQSKKNMSLKIYQRIHGGSLEMDCSQNLKIITRAKAWFMFRWHIFGLKKSEKFVKNKLFKNFTAYRQKRYWSIAWYCLFIILLMDWNNIYSFLFGSKCTSSQRVLKYQSKYKSMPMASLWCFYC